MEQFFERPRLNGKLLQQYGCELVSYSVGAIQTTDGYIAQSRSYRPVGLNRNYSVRPISITVEFMGVDLRDTTRNVSNLTATLRGDCDLLLPDGFYYFGRLAEDGEPTFNANFIQTITYTLYGYRHEELQSKTLTETGTVYCTGNLPAEVRFKITPSGSTVKVFGITVTGITSIGTLLIDGIEKKIMLGNTNAFKNSDLDDFPVLQPGNNRIDISGASSVVVEWYPVWQ